MIRQKIFTGGKMIVPGTKKNFRRKRFLTYVMRLSASLQKAGEVELHTQVRRFFRCTRHHKSTGDRGPPYRRVRLLQHLEKPKGLKRPTVITVAASCVNFQGARGTRSFGRARHSLTVRTQ
jgi:hypothetical protein